MKIRRPKCRRSKGYTHYWEKRGGDCRKVGKDGSWDREILLICARCDRKMYVDSMMRFHERKPDIWTGT